MIFRDASDNAWLLSNAFVILTMQAGFGMLEAGMVSAKSTANILMKNLGDLSFGSVAYFISGYGLSYGKGNSFAGNEFFFLVGLQDYPMWLFQFAFAATASTILSGAVAGRMKFTLYLILSMFVTGVVYPIASRWAWSSEGWLLKMDYHDFAGCGPIHLLGGIMGMVGTWVLGPRIGVFNSEGQFIPQRSSPVHCIFGTFVLYWGWFSFNAGSTQAVSGGNDVLAGKAATNTGVASGCATMTTVALSLIRSKGKTVDVFETTAGALAGLVSITAACGVVEPWEAFIIGFFGALIAYYSPAIPISLRMDDPVGVFPVHVVGGFVGMIAVGLFSKDQGLFHGHGFKSLGVQMLAVVAYCAWGIVTTFMFLWGLGKITPLRVHRNGELIGLDEAEHSIVTMKLVGLFDIADNSGENRRSSLSRMKEEQVFYTKTEVKTARSLHNMRSDSVDDVMGDEDDGKLKSRKVKVKPASNKVAPESSESEAAEGQAGEGTSASASTTSPKPAPGVIIAKGGQTVSSQATGNKAPFSSAT